MSLYSLGLKADDHIVEDVPDIDLLEFLGEWQTAEGEWVDPEEFESESYTALDETKPDDQYDE